MNTDEKPFNCIVPARGENSPKINSRIEPLNRSGNNTVTQAFQPAGSRDFLVPCSGIRELATGKSPEPAGWKACATIRFMERHDPQNGRHIGARNAPGAPVCDRLWVPASGPFIILVGCERSFLAHALSRLQAGAPVHGAGEVVAASLKIRAAGLAAALRRSGRTQRLSSAEPLRHDTHVFSSVFICVHPWLKTF
jgi:hypothetical protein